MATDSDIEGFVSLLLQFIDGNIFSDFHSAFDFNAELKENIDFSINDILFQLVGRNSITPPSARKRILLEDGRLISHRCKIVGTA